MHESDRRARKPVSIRVGRIWNDGINSRSNYRPDSRHIRWTVYRYQVEGEMSRLTREQVVQLRSTRKVEQEKTRGWDEKFGDAEQYRLTVDIWRIRNGMKPMVWR